MKVFYWTEPWGTEGRRLYQVDADNGFAAEVPSHAIEPGMMRAMLEDGFVEISATTAYKLGLPT